MSAKVKGQGHKVTLDENAQSAISVICTPNFFLLFFSTNFFETWLVYRQYLAHLPCEFSGPHAKGQGHSESKQKMGVSAESANDTIYFK